MILIILLGSRMKIQPLIFVSYFSFYSYSLLVSFSPGFLDQDVNLFFPSVTSGDGILN
jgi:hypothetical protein